MDLLADYRAPAAARAVDVVKTYGRGEGAARLDVLTAIAAQ